MMKKDLAIRNIRECRRLLSEGLPIQDHYKREEEGGCGVTGFAASVPVRGKHIYEPSKQMHNRGNGLGGGIAAMGLDPEMLGVSREILEESYMLQIAVLEPGVMENLEKRFIKPWFRIDFSEAIPHLADFRDVEGLTVKPPEIRRYFVRAKPQVLREFMKKNNLHQLTQRQAEDEFVFQNSYKINKAYYDVYKKQSAFVVSHGRNFLVLKIVGYAEQVVDYYQLEDLKAHIWIAHQRYPTKGNVWHPAGAHPFVGLNEALVHNGDFANYHSVAEHLRQKSIQPLFLTDTEVSVLLFDLYSRVYGYPLEYVIEALAPTMERDFQQLSPEKRRAYQAIQSTHIHGSPDGPWFFIIARNDTENSRLQLIGITDTAMLRPQVFALHDGNVRIGLICSEKQAIDATLKSIAGDDPRVESVADRYWNARGGSYTDGGAFIFSLDEVPSASCERRLTCTDKFGNPVNASQDPVSASPDRLTYMRGVETKSPLLSGGTVNHRRLDFLYEYTKREGRNHTTSALLSEGFFEDIKRWGLKNDAQFEVAIKTLTKLLDLRYPTNGKKRRFVLRMTNETLESMFRRLPGLSSTKKGAYRLIDWATRQSLRGPMNNEMALAIDASLFPPEGEENDSRLMVEAFHRGWKHFFVFGLKGQRFHGCGLGPGTNDIRIDIYGSSGDYLGSGIDGLSLYVHGNAQDQVGQIMKSGTLVIYGDTGQTFMYGAKGGEVYIMGNAAGRPLINAVGRPRVVINGTCLDYLAESFMAGDPLNGGGFVIVNGVEFDDHGRVRPQPVPYPGSNLFSLASGGAIYIRDPFGHVDDEQLNGGEIVVPEQRDWELILPYLKENERLFGISVEKDLLVVNGNRMSPYEVYRKVRPQQTKLEHTGLEEWQTTKSH